MKVFSKLIVAGCLLCAAPLVLACDTQHRGEYGDKYFKEMDKNGDGVVTRKEYEAFHNAHFKEMDTNHDGKLTREEMETAHHKMVGKCDEQSFDERFDEVDINHDGSLSKDEAEIGMPMLFEHFDEIDANKDGKITKEELDAAMKKMHDKMHEKMEQKHGDGMMKREQP